MCAPRRIAYDRTSPGDRPRALPEWSTFDVDATFTDEDVGPRSVGRPQRRAALAALRKGDTLVVHSLNRLARTREELSTLLGDLAQRGVTVELIQEAITLSPSSPEAAARERALVMAGLQWQLDRYSELQRVGIKKAVKVQRRYTGRPMKLSPAKTKAMVERYGALAQNPDDTATKIANDFDVSRETLYRYVRAGEKLLKAATVLKRAKGQSYRATAAAFKVSSTESERLAKVARKTKRHGIALRREAFAHGRDVSLDEAVAATQPEVKEAARALADTAKAERREQRAKKR